MANHVDVDYKPLEGVHMLDESSYRKYARMLSVLTCETCHRKHGEAGIDIKRCTGCLGVGFCSKECQRQLWPKHKGDCNGLQIVLIIEDLVRNLCSDAFILHFLRVALIFKLDLVPPKPATKYTAKRVIICETVHLHISPKSAEQQVDLIMGKLDPQRGDDEIPGYLTLGINQEPTELIPISGGHELSVRLYKQARKEADSHVKRKNNPIVLVRFGYDTESLVYGIELTQDAFVTARGDTPTQTIPPSMEGVELKSL
ncbi:hypothetical protein HYPSUDRAFT_47008 [Hypholoma sublateritium FD-334 SS-4]|uniref:MYND-type domain-containing protein n=1 Tax=Hypholoma sublateritium (strain FD-334 SS-4) TaxID=945553 RepID=A0A0D2M0L2_HYPSF|nr:hypothetical protein HYPSUDRAFT_47008 [Hypholoma sublateritium FD-334 SS-4]